MRCTTRGLLTRNAHPNCRAVTISCGPALPRILLPGPRRGPDAVYAAGRMGLPPPVPVVKCQVCREGEAVKGAACPYCGATVMSVPGRGAPLPREIAAEAEERRRAVALQREAYVRERAKGHAIAGALTFGLLGFLSAMAALLWLLAHIATETALEGATGAGQVAAAEGVPPTASAIPSILFGLALAFLLSAVLGAPTGYVLSHLQRGPYFGALAGIGVFGLSAVILNLGNILACGSPWLLLALCVAIGTVPGAGAGYFLGWQILWDD